MRVDIGKGIDLSYQGCMGNDRPEHLRGRTEILTTPMDGILDGKKEADAMWWKRTFQDVNRSRDFLCMSLREFEGMVESEGVIVEESVE